MTSKFRTLAATSVTVGALLLSGCGMFSGNTTPSEYVADSAITSKIKADYAADTRVPATAVSVETMNGTVLLSGFVKTAAEKANAEEIARSTKGVKSVRNALVVRP